jgi:hypothetical protein
MTPVKVRVDGESPEQIEWEVFHKRSSFNSWFTYRRFNYYAKAYTMSTDKMIKE